MAKRPDISLSIAIMLFALAFSGLRLYSRLGGRNRHASGTVTLLGTSLGSSGFNIEGCKKVDVSGDFPFGADLIGSDRYNMRLVRSERDDDVRLSVYPKGNPGAAIPIDKAGCSQWQVGFYFEDPQTLDVVGGRAEFTCAFAGGKIDGMVFADHCRP